MSSIDRATTFGTPAFAGVLVKELGVYSDAGHDVRIELYRFADGSEVPYVRLTECHGSQVGSRIYAISTLVHLAHNVTDGEVWEIGAREPNPRRPSGFVSRNQLRTLADELEAMAPTGDGRPDVESAREATMVCVDALRELAK